MELLNFLKKIKNYFYFKIDSYRNYYPYKLLGESKKSTQQLTYVKYKDYGYSTIFEKSIKEIYENKEFLYQFHPEDVTKITFIAFGELFFSEKKEIIQKKFQEIRHQMINQMGDD